MINEQWQDRILGYDEECLSPHMKILIVKWHRIKNAAAGKGKLDKYGYVWLPIGYFAKCCGVHLQTMKRTLQAMEKAHYVEKEYKNKGQEFQQMGVKMCQCVYDAQFDILPTTNKGRNQKRFFCLDCGSRDVVAEPVTYQILCKSCGSIHFQTSKGKAAGKPQKESEHA